MAGKMNMVTLAGGGGVGCGGQHKHRLYDMSALLMVTSLNPNSRNGRPPITVVHSAVSRQGDDDNGYRCTNSSFCSRAYPPTEAFLVPLFCLPPPINAAYCIVSLSTMNSDAAIFGSRRRRVYQFGEDRGQGAILK